jgi:pimeloyl-ACP methyl ester carboxylesterase
MPSSDRSGGHRRPRRGLTALIAAAALCVSMIAAATPAGADETTTTDGSGGTPVPVPELAWVPCQGGFECATATVPLDYTDPDGRTISLAVARLPAANPDQKIGTLFFNLGGPGAPAVSFLLSFGSHVFPPQIHEHFDIVAVDPRGVDLSTRVNCFETDGEWLVFNADDVWFPTTPEEEQREAEKSIQLAEMCWERQGWLMPHLSTANVVRDFEALRQAVGDERFNFVGYSYGTYVGATYANLYPDTVGRLVLDGAMSTTYGGPLEAGATPSERVGSDVGSAEALQHFFDLCTEAGDACPFGADGDPRAKFEELLARVSANPIPLDFGGGVTFSVDYDTLIAIAISDLYLPFWDILAFDLQFFYEETGVEAATQLVNNATGLGRHGLVRMTEHGPGLSIADDVSVALQCGEADTPDDPFLWPQLAAEAEARAPFAGELWMYAGQQPCASWPQRDANRYLGPWDAETAHPALIIGNLWDPATPYDNAVALSKEMPNSVLLTLDGVGHTAFGSAVSTCVDRITIHYLVTGAPPAEGTVCQPNFPPLTPPEAIPVEQMAPEV